MTSQVGPPLTHRHLLGLMTTKIRYSEPRGAALLRVWRHRSTVFIDSDLPQAPFCTWLHRSLTMSQGFQCLFDMFSSVFVCFETEL